MVQQLRDTFFLNLDVGRQAFGVYAQLARSFVDEVYRLVGELTPGDVSVTETRGGHQGGIVDIYLVMGFVPGPQDA